jgi:hypothetical protein
MTYGSRRSKRKSTAWWWIWIPVLFLWVMVIMGTMDNVTASTSIFEAFRDWSSWIVAMATVVIAILLALRKWLHDRNPWEMDFRIAEYPDAGETPAWKLARSEVDKPRGKYMLHITLRCRSTTHLDKSNTSLVMGLRPSSRHVIWQGLESRLKLKQKIWPNATGWKQTILPRVERDSIGSPPQIGNITTAIERNRPRSVHLQGNTRGHGNLAAVV